MKAHFILYVADQERSTAFYSSVLGQTPILHAPGMSVFSIGGTAVLGLMPEAGIVRLLGDAIDHPSLVQGVPRAELYLVVQDPAVFHARAIAAGAREISPLAVRDWGHSAAYSLDPDGHVLAFASASKTSL